MSEVGTGRQTHPASAKRNSEGSSETARAASARTSGWSRRLLLVLVLLSALCLVAQAILWVGVSRGISRGIQVQEAAGGVAQSGNAPEARGISDALGTYMVMLMALTTGCFGTILYLFAKKVVVPLRGVNEVASEIAAGNLSASVPSSLRHEMGDLGQTVNDVAANFQEVLLFTGTTVGNVRCSLEEVEKLLKSEALPNTHSRLPEHVEAAKRDLDGLGSVVQSFTFYQASFSGWDVKHACPEEAPE